VYAADVKSASLVADGPYRHVRNPLYLANALMAIGMGATMSRSGFLVAVAAMMLFSYRLILREEADLQAARGDQYARYRDAVPRLWPSLRPHVPASGARARWRAGFLAESWCWGFSAGVAAFALTLSTMVFFVIAIASLAVFWKASTLLQTP
jgi:hypothetical protein